MEPVSYRAWAEDVRSQHDQQDWSNQGQAEHHPHPSHYPRPMNDRPPYQDYLPKEQVSITHDGAEFVPGRAGGPLPLPAGLGPGPQTSQYNHHPNSPYQPPYNPTHQHLVDYQNSKFNTSTYSSPTSASEPHFPAYNSHSTLAPVRTSPDYSNRFANQTLDSRVNWRPTVGEEPVGPAKYRNDSIVSQDSQSSISRAPFNHSIQTNHQRFEHQNHQFNYQQEPNTPAAGHSAGSHPTGYYYQPATAAPAGAGYSPSHHPASNYSPAHQPHHQPYGYPSPLPTAVRHEPTGSDYVSSLATSNRPQSFVNSPLAQQQSFAAQQEDSHPQTIYSYPGQGSAFSHGLPLASGSSSGSLTRPPTRANSITDQVANAAPSLAYANAAHHHNRQNSPAPRQYLPPPLGQPALPPLSSVVSPLIPTPAIPFVHAASSARRIFRSRPPPLAFNPAREPSASARLTKTLTSQGLVVPAQGAKGKAVLEVVGSCWTCGEPSCKVILRGQDLSFGPRLSFTCLACVPEAGQSQSPEDGNKRAGSKRPKADEKEAVYSDTLSAAVDVIEGSDIRRDEEETPEATCSRLPEQLKPQGMKCDVCDRIVGCGTIAPADPHAGPAPPFTSEVICSRCTERYRACSDCGGGGGRLTPGRWRCKELFPQGRRTCQLSHARNPPLNEITYHVLPIVSLSDETREDLKASCRQLYFNTRLRVTARPEMLERGDGLCRTFAEAEKLTIDGWGLLQPLMEIDIERERGVRRYVAVQYSIPHRRRAKSKNEPPPEEVTERTVSGFMLVEYEFATGSVYFAVVMPWALSGDAFDATTRLGDEVMVQCRADLALMNDDRARQGFPAYPPLSWNWGITPFKKESRMTQSLTRRGFIFLDELIASGEMPEEDLAMFPGYGAREIHVPKECEQSSQPCLALKRDVAVLTCGCVFLFLSQLSRRSMCSRARWRTGFRSRAPARVPLRERNASGSASGSAPCKWAGNRGRSMGRVQ